MYRESLTDEMMDHVDRLVEDDKTPSMLFMRDADGVWWGMVGAEGDGLTYIKADSSVLDGLYQQIINHIQQGEATP